MEQSTKNLKWSSPKKMVFFTLGGIVGLSVTLLAFEWGFYASLNPLKKPDYVSSDIYEMPPIPMPEDEKEKVKSVKTFTTQENILKLVEKEQEKEPLGQESDADRDGDTSTGTVSIIDIPDENEPDENEPVYVAEIMPAFGKCTGIKDETRKMECTSRELGAYFQQNIVYPERDKSIGFEGIVYVRFIVDEDGNVVNPEISRGVSRNIDAEALRVVRKMPKWSPGKQGFRNVSVIFTLPINFSIQ